MLFRAYNTLRELLKLADREGFEPSVTLLPHTLSKRAHSTTLTPALGGGTLGTRSGIGNLFLRSFQRKGRRKNGRRILGDR